MKKNRPKPPHEVEVDEVLLTYAQVASLFMVSISTVYNWTRDGKIQRVGPNLLPLRSVFRYYAQLRVADVVVAGAKRNEKLDEEVKKLKLESELKALEIDSSHRERLSLLTQSDLATLQLHDRVFSQLAIHVSRTLAIEVGALLSAVPAFKSWTNKELAELSIAWAEKWVEQEAIYLLGPEGSGFADGQCWRDAQIPTALAEKPRDLTDGTPFYVDSGEPEGTHWGPADEPGGWFRCVAVNDPDIRKPRYKFERLENYAGEPPKSILRSLMALGKNWRKAIKEKGAQQ